MRWQLGCATLAPMAHILCCRVLSFVAVFALTAVLAFAQDSVAGRWLLEVDSPQGAMKAGLVVAVDGETVTGSITNEMGETPIKGTFKDGTIKFTFDYAGPQGAMTITTTGTVSGDEVKGEMDYGMGTAPFVGKRAEK